MRVINYLVTLAIVLTVVAGLAYLCLSWAAITALTTLQISIVFSGFWLIGLISVGLMKLMGVETTSQLMRYMMLSKTLRILLSLLMLIAFALFQDSTSILPTAILVFVGYMVSLLVESWYQIKANRE